MFGFRFDAARDPAGLVSDRDGRLATVDGVVELRQSLTMLLSTRPGERRLHPDFGCPLDRLLFERNDATTAGLAIRIVADAVSRFEPRAEIDAIDAYPDPEDPSRLVIDLTYRDKRSGQADRLRHVTGLPGAS